MPRQKRHTLAAQRSNQIRTRWISERRLDDRFFTVVQLGHVVQTAPADHTYLNV
jgi:hypothetical protein